MPSRLPCACLSILLLCACARDVAGEVPAQAAGIIAIGEVQGEGARSPLEGRPVVVEGVVTGDFRAGLGGFFVQDRGDGDARTSDALFVIAAADPAAAAHTDAPRIGNRIRVAGRVVEIAGRDGAGTLTAIEPERIERIEHTSRDLPAPLVLTGPLDDWESVEGMRVRIDAPLTVNGFQARYGETLVSFDGRLWTPGEVAVPSSVDSARIIADNARRRLVLDDASNQRDPDGLWYLPGGMPRSGGTANEIEGIVDQRHGAYRLQLTAPLRLTPAARPPAPKVEGNLRVAVFNLENLFNGDGRGRGFPTQRGAKTPEQLQKQTAKLVATLRALDADIAALMELENDGYGPQSSLAQFVDALNADGGDWRFVDAGTGPGADEIRVGLVYRASKVKLQGKPATLEGGPFGERSRVPLAQAFRRGDGPVFVVVANHFKSKGCSEAVGADADQRDGQGCWNALRTNSSRRLDAWLKSDPTGHGPAPTLVVGDFNAYAMEQPVRTLREAGWQDAFHIAGVERPYSYVYDGQAGRLDHALLSPSLAKRLRGAAEWHSNADEPEGEGYADSDDPGPWRSSDHDPMLLGFDL